MRGSLLCKTGMAWKRFGLLKVPPASRRAARLLAMNNRAASIPDSAAYRAWIFSPVSRDSSWPSSIDCMNARVANVTAETTKRTASSNTALRRLDFRWVWVLARIVIVLMNSFHCWKFLFLPGRMGPTEASIQG